MDRATEKHLRNLESDLKTTEETLREAEDRVLRLISRLGTLKSQILKVRWHDASEHADALENLLREIERFPGPVNAVAWGEVKLARDALLAALDDV